jgi:PAS domain-containing protein
MTNKKLEESEMRIKALVKGTQAVILSADCNGVITYCSDYVQNLMGMTQNYMLNRNPADWPYVHSPNSKFALSIRQGQPSIGGLRYGFVGTVEKSDAELPTY